MKLAAIICMCCLALSAAGQNLPAASDGTHLWAVTPGGEGGNLVVWHRTGWYSSDTLNRARELHGKLSSNGIAAAEGVLWLVYSDNSVQSLRAVQGELPSQWGYIASMARSLPEGARLRALAADAAGPWALVSIIAPETLAVLDRPAPKPEPKLETLDRSTVERNLILGLPPSLDAQEKPRKQTSPETPQAKETRESSEAQTPPVAPADDAGPRLPVDRLLRLTAQGWREQPLPEDWPHNAPRSDMVMADRGEHAPLLLAQTGAEVPRRTLAVFEMNAHGPWQRQDYTLRSVRRWSPAIANGQLLLAQQDEKSMVDLSILRRGKLHRISPWLTESPGVDWTLLGADALVVLIDDSPAAEAGSEEATATAKKGKTVTEPRLRWSAMDLSGQIVRKPTSLVADQLAARGRSMQTVTVAVVVLALLMLLLLWQREPQGAQISLGEQTQVAELWRRIAAGWIDIGVPILVVMAYFDLDLAQLRQHWPGVQTDPARILPAAAVMGLFLLHVTISECVTCVSLGKLIMGLRVARRDGSRPRLWQLLLRNVLKAFDLIAPWLLVLPLLSPTRERLGDLAARTLVVMKKKKRSDG